MEFNKTREDFTEIVAGHFHAFDTQDGQPVEPVGAEVRSVDEWQARYRADALFKTRVDLVVANLMASLSGEKPPSPRDSLRKLIIRAVK